MSGDGKTNRAEMRKLNRRDFLSMAGAASVGLILVDGVRPVMAGPFENAYRKVIPADKKLSAAWIRALYEPGRKEIYSDPAALKHIGMPVGGLFAGTVYLSGDGRLWLWDIFNRDQEGVDPRQVDCCGSKVKNRDGANFVEPARIKAPFKQGFFVHTAGEKRSLDSGGFSTITFEGRYPIGRVTYADADCPIKISLEAFSPFIPLNTDESSLPATILNYQLTNPTDQAIAVEIGGFMENAVCLDSRKELSGRRINRAVSAKDYTAVVCSAKADAALGQDTIEKQKDYGTMAIAVLEGGTDNEAAASVNQAGLQEQAEAGFNDELAGQVCRRLTLQAGQSQTVTFAVAWHFPNFFSRGAGKKTVGHYYASRFAAAEEVVRYIADNKSRLIGQTQKWVQTWYDSTLPQWLLDRTMANTSTLATTTCYRFRDGRFWAWEGVGCCEGTCTHVWHYAQAPGRLFPEIERIERQCVNFGIGLHEDGAIGMRTNLVKSNEQADDGQCGRILGAYREHQMSVDPSFLSAIWPNVKKAIQYMIRKDANADGLIEGAQNNTLDAAWYGKISFISSLYIAALRAGQQMALEMGDEAFAGECQTIAQRGAEKILELYNGEYFIQIEDPAHRQAVGTGDGCYIDQVFGQTWAYWVNLGVLFDRQKQVSALRSLWTYNFVPDAGVFRNTFKPGRWYAMAGDAGLVMCTWPRSELKPNEKHWQAMYFNECMSGFEWQAAAHMIWEGLEHPDLLEKGLAVSRAIHDRYNASVRNPYNEIECSDHYARAMASYGVFQAVCGFNCHGPKGHIEFSPRLTPENFKAAFTAAEGWGSYWQKAEAGGQRCGIELHYGTLRLKTIGLAAAGVPKEIKVIRDGEPVKAALVNHNGQLLIQLDSELTLHANNNLEIRWV